MERSNLQFLPVSLNVTGKKILVIGGGRVGWHKSALLARFTVEVTVLAERFDERFGELPHRRVCKRFEPRDLDGYHLVYVCTENRPLNAEIKKECEGRGILASVCDDPELCDFVSPAIYRNGDLTVAVGSNARDVHRSIRVRDRIRKFAEEETLAID